MEIPDDVETALWQLIANGNNSEWRIDYEAAGTVEEWLREVLDLPPEV